MGVSTSLVNGSLGTHHSFQTGGFFIAHYSEIIRFATPSIMKIKLYENRREEVE
jgi:hypothetical protein